MIWQEQAIRKELREPDRVVPADVSRRYPQIGIETISAIVFGTLLVLTVLATVWILVMLLRH
jgi:hypothetical protein